MPAPAPFFSIIVVCRNPGPRLQAALDSVWTQRGAEAEIVVIDGASTDGTAAWLENRRDRFGTLVSEPDTGVYQAMNRGVQQARGQWLLFLGADDVLADSQVLARVRAAIGEAAGGLFCGEAAYADGRVWRAPLNPGVRYRNFLHHQACFYHRSVFVQSGFDEKLTLQADYDFNLRLWQRGIRPQPLALRVAVCASGGLSDAGAWTNYREEITVRHRHFPAWQCWPADAGSFLRFLRKQLVRRERIN